MAQPDAGMVATVGLASPFALFIARQDEALGVVVVIAGAQIVVAGGVLAATAGRFVGPALDFPRERAPFLPPGLRLVLPQPHPLPGPAPLPPPHPPLGGPSPPFAGSSPTHTTCPQHV